MCRGRLASSCCSALRRTRPLKVAACGMLPPSAAPPLPPLATATSHGSSSHASSSSPSPPSHTSPLSAWRPSAGAALLTLPLLLDAASTLQPSSPMAPALLLLLLLGAASTDQPSSPNRSTTSSSASTFQPDSILNSSTSSWLPPPRCRRLAVPPLPRPCRAAAVEQHKTATKAWLLESGEQAGTGGRKPAARGLALTATEARPPGCFAELKCCC